MQMNEYKTKTYRDVLLIDPNYMQMIDRDKLASAIKPDECSLKVKTNFYGVTETNTFAQVENSSSSSIGTVAVLSINGPIDFKPGLIEMLFMGAIDLNELENAFLSLVDDPNVKTIILDVDSPGGSSIGVAEFSETIFKARERKRIVSLANPMSASAAFWISSAATESFVMPSGFVGSVGAFILHMDFSELLKNEGIKPTFIFAGEKKVDGNEFEPLSKETEKELQAMVDDVFNQFVTDIARNRGTSFNAVASNFGQGGIVEAKIALNNGMVDGIMNFRDLISRELGAVTSGNSGSAAFNNALYTLELEGLKNE